MDADPITVVVTGATGFVGKALLDACAMQSNVQGRALVRGDNRLESHSNLKVICGDLDNIPKALFPDHAHVLIHLATKNLDHDKKGYSHTNIAGTENLLACCNGYTKGIIYNSSLSVLGQAAQTNSPNSLLTCPQTPLARSRAEAEKRVLQYAQQKNCFAYCLRPRFVLGAGDEFVMPALAKVIRKGIYVGDGSQKYSIIDVKDYAQVILQLALRCMQEDKPEQIPLNIGYEIPVAFSDIYSAVQKTSVRTIPKRKIPAPGLIADLLNRLPLETLKAKATQLQLIGLDHYGDVSDTASRLQNNLLNKNSIEYIKALASQY